MSFLPFVTWPRALGVCMSLMCLILLGACQDDLVEPAYFGSISGTVLDARTNLPLANASVSTNPATSTYVTNAQGKFEIKDVPAGKVSITITKADYQQTVSNVTVSDSQNADVTIQLLKSTSSTTVSAPDRPVPANQTTGLPNTVRLAWRPVNAVASDSLTYEVSLFESNNTSARTVALKSPRDTTVTVSNLRYNTTYFWYVTVRNPAGASARSPIWTFQTGNIIDNRYLFVRKAGNNSDVFAADITGATVTQLTFTTALEAAPQLNPNRDLIAYTSNVTGDWQLYTMNRDGSNQRQITFTGSFAVNNGGQAGAFRWSPDGSQLIYCSSDKLYRINRDGLSRTIVATAPLGKTFRECDWTAENGGHIVAQVVGTNIYDSAIYLYDANGTQQGAGAFIPDTPGRLDSPSFSLDGRSIVYTQDIAQFESSITVGRQINAHIFIKRLDGSATVDVSAGITGSGTTTGKTNGTNDLTPRFSPTGSKLIFVNQDNDGVATPEIWTCNPDGSGRIKLFDNASMPDWK
ncbi:carboxypeptidase-like regulatory domain-containing protein [Hymenobacter monticola]|uniref:Carboxypeptidase regulatory-like domain-containing protein n=1 Tax=Hymenobacter monticola TaxID=1705399 RepID=A0ABY4B7D7_9BACT|nr:carboxypeptidase-like regulatory domain-containing protein [Hymenobacter monticola]UOE35090.1 carboxypeptidase regulatory-like domain-containing protein [Hymenobacter monticola]